MAKLVCFLWGCLFNISSLMSQAFSMIHKASILHVLGDLNAKKYMDAKHRVFQAASVLLTATAKQAREQPELLESKRDQSTQRLIGKMPQEPFCSGNL